MPKPLMTRPIIICGRCHETIWRTAPTTLQTRPSAMVFLRPSLSPRVKAKMAPQKAPSCTLVRVFCSWTFPGMTYRKAARGDAGDVGLLGLGEVVLEVGRDQNTREDALVVAEPRHGDCGESASYRQQQRQSLLPALTTVMQASSQLPRRLLKNPMLRVWEWLRGGLPVGV